MSCPFFWVSDHLFVIMFSSANIILLPLSAIISLALSIPPSSLLQAPDVAGEPSSHDPLFEGFSNVTATRRKLYCDPYYGVNLPADSCQNALAKFSRNTEGHVYVPRHDTIPQGAIPLPIRYLGDDGKCAIDAIIPAVRRHSRPSLNVGLFFGKLDRSMYMMLIVRIGERGRCGFQQ